MTPTEQATHHRRILSTLMMGRMGGLCRKQGKAGETPLFIVFVVRPGCSYLALR